MNMLRRITYALLGSALLLTGARAADPVNYQVRFAPSGDAELDRLLKQTASLVSLQKKLPPAPFALIGRAQADEAQFLTVLHSLGYDGGSVSITIAGQALNDPTLLDTLSQAPGTPPVIVQVTPNKGPLYHIGLVSLGALPAGFTPALALRSGEPARAAPILAVTDDLKNRLQNDGYAFATVSAPVAIADGQGNNLDISYSVVAGPRVDIGAIEFAGLKRTDPDWLRRHIELTPGQRYSNTAISAARDSLLETGVFASVTPVPQRGPGGEVPILFRVQEQKLHAVTIGGSYATDVGFTISSSWENRNVFGHAETLTFTAAASGLGGSGTTAPGYDLKGVFVKPDYYRPGQALTLSVEGQKESLNAYSRTALLLNAAISRPLSPHLTLGYGLGFVSEAVKQEDVGRNYVLLQAPVSLAYNTTDNVLEPTKGINASLEVTPTKPVVGDSGVFLITQAVAATYLSLERNARGVLALRALLGSIQGASQFQVPPDQRFYAGGSSTIRGYAYQKVGPLFPDEIPEGGNAIDTATIEFRQRVYGNFGIVTFADAGQVSAGSAPFAGTLVEGAGLGARYYTGIGPIRVDFAKPLKYTHGSGAFQLYIGLGEAF
jgi:translocation and assembly module TamA